MPVETLRVEGAWRVQAMDTLFPGPSVENGEGFPRIFFDHLCNLGSDTGPPTPFPESFRDSGGKPLESTWAAIDTGPRGPEPPYRTPAPLSFPPGILPGFRRETPGILPA